MEERVDEQRNVNLQPKEKENLQNVTSSAAPEKKQIIRGGKADIGARSEAVPRGNKVNVKPGEKVTVRGGRTKQPAAPAPDVPEALIGSEPIKDEVPSRRNNRTTKSLEAEKTILPEQTLPSFEHAVKMTSREQMDLTGVIGIEHFTKESFILETAEGRLNITGEELKVNTLDSHKGTAVITGKIEGFSYLREDAPKKGMFGIFKSSK